MTTPALTEAQFQTRVIDTARRLGWHVAHFRPARTALGGWTTPITGDRGFPDLVLARDGHVILAELKSDTGRLGPGQADWLTALGEHGCIWQPKDWDEVLRELTTTGRSSLSARRKENL